MSHATGAAPAPAAAPAGAAVPPAAAAAAASASASASAAAAVAAAAPSDVPAHAALSVPHPLVSLDAVRWFCDELCPFNRHVGVRSEFVGRGKATLSVHANSATHIGDFVRGNVHGGAVATLIDVACGMAVSSVLTVNQSCATADLRVDYLAPGKEGLLVCDATVIRHGGRSAVVDAVVMQGAERIALGRANFRVSTARTSFVREAGDHLTASAGAVTPSPASAAEPASGSRRAGAAAHAGAAAAHMGARARL